MYSTKQRQGKQIWEKRESIAVNLSFSIFYFKTVRTNPDIEYLVHGAQYKREGIIVKLLIQDNVNLYFEETSSKNNMWLSWLAWNSSLSWGFHACYQNNHEDKNILIQRNTNLPPDNGRWWRTFWMFNWLRCNHKLLTLKEQRATNRVKQRWISPNEKMKHINMGENHSKSVYLVLRFLESFLHISLLPQLIFTWPTSTRSLEM